MKIQKPLLATLIAVFVLGVSFVPQSVPVQAQSVDELQQKTAELQSEIAENKDRMQRLSGIAETLEEKVEQLTAEIEQANKEIKLTEVELEKLRNSLAEAEIELEKRKELLRATLQALYERKGASTFELLMATDSFTDFMNEQEYLSQLQTAVKQATDEVILIKQKIEAEKNQQEELLAKQEQQRNIVAAKRREQNKLLEDTRGEESRYRTLVYSQLAQLQEAEDELSKLLTAGTFVSQGPVSKGQKIGDLGSTGFSTGPHIHFQVRKNGVTQNPYAGVGRIINGYSWPLAGGVGWVSQAYGCVAPAWFYPVLCNGGTGSFHDGLDIAASAYTPVIAVADGDIVYRGCKGALGYVVVVDHGGGWQTWYPHMTTPSGQVYGYCG